MPSKSVQLQKIPVAQQSRECQNVECLITERDMKLEWCSKCRSACYCSKLCQKKDWKRHKPTCILNAKTREYLRTCGLTYNGYTADDVYKMIKKWTQVNRPLLSSSAVNALATKPNQYLWKTHALCIFLEPAFTNPNVTRPKEIAKGFTIDFTAIFPFEEAFGLLPGDDDPEHRQKMNIFLEERKAYPYSTLVLLYVIPLKIVRIVPDGYQASFNITEAPKHPEWEWNLKRMVREGFVI